MRFLLSICLFLVVVSCKEKSTTPRVEIISVEEMREVLKAEAVQLIDVRTRNEYASNHIKNAKNIVYQGDDWEAQIATLDAKNKLKNQWFIFGGISLLTLFTLLWLVRSRRFAKKKQALQVNFTQKLIKTQEEERIRVARELHDSVGQKLMLISRKTKNSEDTDLSSLTDDTLHELRTILKGMHPTTLEKLGFSKAIQSLINDIDANTPIFFTAEVDSIDTFLTKDVSLHLYRIIQEILSNIVKHSDTKSASILIQKEAQNITVIIEDKGKGFNFLEKYKSAKSLGMKTLLERAKIIESEIKINSILEKGTTVTLHIPIKNE